MRLFHPRARLRDADSARRHALGEIARTVVDCAAALLFVVGGALFRDESTKPLFLIGSACFALKSALRLAPPGGGQAGGACG